MLRKLFGGGKKKEFFLELDEAQGDKPTEAKAETPAQPEPQQESKTEATAVEDAPKKPEKATKSKKKSVKKTAKKEAPKPQPTTATTNGQVAKKEEPKEVEFATKFFMVPMSRRRPGPSLNNFKDMARQVKVPRR